MSRHPLPDAQAVLHILEAAYRLEQTPEAWLEGVSHALLPSLTRGAGLHSYLVDISNPDAVRMWSPTPAGLTPEWDRRWRENWWDVFMTPVDSQTMHWLHRFSVCSFARELWDAGAAAISSYAEYLSALAADGYGRTHHRYLRPGSSAGDQRMFYPDSFNIAALDATGVGCVFLVNLPEPSTGPVSPAEAALWGQIAGHLSGALRLLRPASGQSPRSAFDTAEAIVDPEGHFHHASGAARSAGARDVIRNAAMAIDRARVVGRLDQKETLEAWQAMTSGRWTMVDQFDSDGRRFFLARPNAPEVRADPLLTTREQQVVAHASLGHGNKLIAYELGLSTGTVATHLASASRKFGVRTRIELIRAFRQHEQTLGAPTPVKPA